MQKSNIQSIYCITPVYNDWASCSVLLERIALLNEKYRGKYCFSTLIINDGSSVEPENFIVPENTRLINLKINLGHQRAIAVGIQYIHSHVPDPDFVIILDSDGEDKPEDIPILLESAIASDKIVFAKRKKRQDSTVFKIGYFVYKRLFRLLTGHNISFGNFSVIPGKTLKKIAVLPNIWNHYSGAIIQSKLPYDVIRLDKGRRYEGRSKMNFTSLILHGLSSIAIYFDQLCVRILIFSLYSIGICLIGVFYILYEKLFTDQSIPGWASSLILIITGIIMQLFTVTLVVLLLQLSTRKNFALPDGNKYLEFIETND